MRRRRSIVSIEFSTESARELLGRQSVRTTFKLSERAISGLSLLSGQLGIKQKSLFDHLMDDQRTLALLTEESANYEIAEPRTTKTYVISKRSFDNLDLVSRRYQIPRDLLVELSIERIIPLLIQEKEKHEKRKEILKSMQELFENGKEILTTVHDELGPDDPVFRRMSQMVRNIKGCCEDIDNCVEKGKKIEDF